MEKQMSQQRQHLEAQLSARLQAVAGMVSEGNTLADIGTDHAYIPAVLILRGTVGHALAMDIGIGPLERAAATLRQYRLEQAVELRRSDGLEKLQPGEADSAVIAGMGGALTIRILQNGAKQAASLKELILEPQSEVGRVRTYLRESGWRITDEVMIEEDGKFYPVMRAIHRQPDTSKENGIPQTDQEKQHLEDLYGPVLLAKRDPGLRAFLRWEDGILARIEAQLDQAESESVRERRVELAEKRRYHDMAEALMGTADAEVSYEEGAGTNHQTLC